MMIKVIATILSIVFLVSCGGSSGNNTTTGNTGNGTSTSTDNSWSIDSNFIQDGGPGKDGIPSLDQPNFQSIDDTTFMFASDLIIGIKSGDKIKGYPHKILDWHEVVNDSLDNERFVLSYCPLTGSAVAWDINNDTGDTEFGVSGLLYNSNLILYDRNTDSNWPQMLMQSANGSKKGTFATQKVIFETTWEKFQLMYPQAQVLDDNTGFSRNYDDYPYGNYRTGDKLLFNVENDDDSRLHKKERVLGVKVGSSTKAYNISEFSSDIEIINDSIRNTAVVIAGSSDDKYAVAFERTVADGTVLEFSAVYNQLPIIMSDNEENQWDINGTAVSGPRAGEQLVTPFSYIVYWFAWASFYTDAPIYH
jgi:hypothetical protein